MGYLHDEHHFRVALVRRHTSSRAVAVWSSRCFLILDELPVVSSEVKPAGMISTSFRHFLMSREEPLQVPQVYNSLGPFPAVLDCAGKGEGGVQFRVWTRASLSPGSTEIWGQIILCCEELSCAVTNV